MTEVMICKSGEIPEGSVRIVEIDTREIGVIRHGESLFAYRNLCPHQGGPACEGIRMAGVFDDVDDQGHFHGQKFDRGDMHIVCPWHGYEFHLSDGVNVCDPALKLRKYAVSERNGDVYLTV